jgi:hypothetical protein
VKTTLSALAVLCTLTVSSTAQSLGDVAKKAAAESKDRPATKVYTDKDLTDAPPRATAAPPITAVASEQHESDRQDEYRRIARKDEAFWKDRMRAARFSLDADRTFLAAAITREGELSKRLNRSSVDDVLPARNRSARTELESQWYAAVAEVSRLKAAVEVGRLAVASIEDEARRANVPPGWLRP